MFKIIDTDYGRVKTRNFLNLPDKSVYYVPAMDSAFYKFTLGERTLALDLVVKENRGFRMISNILRKKGTADQMLDLFADTIRKLKL